MDLGEGSSRNSPSKASMLTPQKRAEERAEEKEEEEEHKRSKSGVPSPGKEEMEIDEEEEEVVSSGIKELVPLRPCDTLHDATEKHEQQQEEEDMKEVEEEEEEVSKAQVSLPRMPPCYTLGDSMEYLATFPLCTREIPDIDWDNWTLRDVDVGDPPFVLDERIQRGIGMVWNNFRDLKKRCEAQNKELDFFVRDGMPNTSPYIMVCLDHTCPSLSRCKYTILSHNDLDQDLQFLQLYERVDQLKLLEPFDINGHPEYTEEGYLWNHDKWRVEELLREESHKFPLLTEEHARRVYETYYEKHLATLRKQEGADLLQYMTSEYEIDSKTLGFQLYGRLQKYSSLWKEDNWLRLDFVAYVNSGGAMDKEPIKAWIVENVAEEISDDYEPPPDEVKLHKIKMERAFQIGAIEKLPLPWEYEVVREYQYVLGDSNPA